jgi:hypothetical protein
MARDTITPYLGPPADGLPVIICPPAREGGMCGCDEGDDGDDEPPKVCLGRECDCV